MKRRSAAVYACFVVCAALLTTVPVFSEEKIHIFQPGETIYSLARAYEVSASAILALNGISDADAKKLQPGRRLRIPLLQAQTSTSWEEYKVQKGDTLYSLARRYATGLESLRELNGFPPNHTTLKEGQILKVPVQGASIAGADSGTPASAPVGGGKTPAKAGAPVGGDALRWPIQARDVSYLTGKLYGITATGERYEAVKSLTTGTVVQAGPYRGFGRVAIVSVNDYLYVYGGCESLSVKEGDKVTPGVEMGKLGTDPKLFFLVYRNNSPVDPAKAPRG